MPRIDDKTGLIEPKFVKLYYEDMSILLGLKANEMKVLMGMIKYMSYTDNLLMLSKAQKGRLLEEIGLTDGSFRNATSSLVKSGVFRRISQGVFQVNPDVVYKGRQSERARIVIDYFADGTRKISTEIVKEDDE